MGGVLALEQEDFDEDTHSQSDMECDACEDNISYGSECVLLRLVYCTPYKGRPVVLDAVDEEKGEYTATPLLYCFECWEDHADGLRDAFRDIHRGGTKDGPNASGVRCAYCSSSIDWGSYCCRLSYGDLDVSPRTKETTFKIAGDGTSEIVCMDCLGWLNEFCDGTIWPELWEDDEEERL
jgi:hypothetical protein